MRLFIAIQLSGKMKEALLDIQGQLRRLGVRGNYTPPENLHLTLAFIGEYPGPDSIADVLETIDFRPFELRLKRARLLSPAVVGRAGGQRGPKRPGEAAAPLPGFERHPL